MWKDKKILITGINGFIASHLAEELIFRGADVHGIVPKGKESKYPLLECDLANTEHTVSAVSEFKPQVIFHLGGQAISSRVNQNPAESFKSNVVSTVSLLEAIRRGHESPLVYASTRDVYASSNPLPYTESQALGSRSLYSSMKLASDELTRAYFSQYGLPVAVVRASNTYGSDDMHWERIIPKTIRSVLYGKRFPLLGNGSASKDFVYVKDVVKGYLLVAEKLLNRECYGQAFNLAGNEPTSVRKIVESIARISGDSIGLEFSSRSEASEGVEYASSEKARKLLGWVPDTPLEKGLRLTYSWYSENRNLILEDDFVHR